MSRTKSRKPRKNKQDLRSPPPRRRTSEKVRLNVLPADLWIEVKRGKTIWEALQNTDVPLEGDCGGLGKCGKCKVKVLSSIGPASDEEIELLAQEELKQGFRLACRTSLDKDLTIYTGDPRSDLEFYQILKMGHRPPLQLDPLIEKQLVKIPQNLRNRGLSELEQIKEALGSPYRNLTASLHCLRTLPEMLQKTDYHGAVVLHHMQLLAWQKWNEVGRRYGLVFDLGTSTLVGKLISLLDGSEIAAISRLNSQVRYGSNVISRLQFIMENRHGLKILHTHLLRDLKAITKRLLDVARLKPRDIFVAVAAGNTTMQHIFLGLNPSKIAQAPFSPVATEGLVVKAEEIGLHLHPEAVVYVMPAKSGYIGGDLVSVILASDAFDSDETVLGLDLGTNGEIFLGNRKRMLTCSAAAGPALEGARISHGMIAKAGAIEGVRLEEGELHYHVIGNIKPSGICGSGLVDLVAVLLHCGLIDSEGLLRRTRDPAARLLNSRLVQRGGVYDFQVVSAKDSLTGQAIYLTQKDIRELQLAKGAVAAGVRTLMHEMNLDPQDLGHIYLAGALGNYINPYSAIRIGLIPQVDVHIVKSIGNAASTGASMVLLSRNSWHVSKLLAGFIEHVELSFRADFNELFIEHMDFPKNNIW